MILTRTISGLVVVRNSPGLSLHFVPITCIWCGWIYQRGFVEGRNRDYLATNPDIKKTTLPPGPESALKERAQINYQDRSWCGTYTSESSCQSIVPSKLMLT